MMAKETTKTDELAKVEEFGPLAELKGMVADLAESFRENVGGSITLFDLDQIQVPAGGGQAWTVETLEGLDSFKTLTGVLVQVQPARQYYKSTEASEGTPPDCASADGSQGFGDRGFEADAKPGPYPCASCPHASWGTAAGKDGELSRGQACKQRLHLLFLHEHGGSMPSFLSVPPTSLKGAKRYLLKLAGRGKKYSTVLTELGLEKASNATGTSYSRITFGYGGDLNPEQKGIAAQLRESMAMVMARGVPVSATAPPEENLSPGGTEQEDDDAPAAAPAVE